MVEYEVDPGGKLQKEINKTIKILGDLSAPYKLMTDSWFKGNVSIFDEGRQGPGKYADLTEPYKTRKERAIGKAYPILRGFLKEPGQPARKSGKLADSMTDPTHPDAVSTVANKTILILGTKVKSKKGHPYPLSLHFGTKNMEARPLALIGGEQVATRQVNVRRDIWIETLRSFTIDSSKGFAT